MPFDQIPHSEQRRGGALILSLMAVLVVAGLAGVLLQISVSTTRRQNQAVDQKQAFYLAEAGLSESFAGLGIGKTGQVGSAAQPAAYGEGLLWVDAVDLGNDLVQLEATALCGGGRVSLGLVAQRTIESVAGLGLFSADDIDVKSDVLVDSFDSTQGAYATQIDTPTNYNAVVGSNADIRLWGSAELRGDAMPGTAGSVSDGGAVFTGQALPRALPATMPPIEVPDLGPASPLNHSSPTPLVLPAGQHSFTDMQLGDATVTVLQGPATVVTGDLHLEKNATLDLDTTNGPIDIYVSGTVDLNVTAQVLLTGNYDPSLVTIQVTSDSSKALNFHCKSTFYGFVYAPDGDVKIGPMFEIFGGLVAKSFDLTTKGRIHYDTAIAQNLRSLPTRVSWRVTDLPAGIAAKGIDPFVLLGLDKNALPAPSQAHPDQWLVIQYDDGVGFLSSYEGWESGFDWTDVSEVHEMYRDGTAVVAPDQWGETGSDPSAAPNDPAAADEAVLLDAIANPLLSSVQLKIQLLDVSPGLTEAVLLAAIARDPAMKTQDLKAVLNANGPDDPAEGPVVWTTKLTDPVLSASIATSSLDKVSKLVVLKSNSPLSASILTAALEINWSPSQLSVLLGAQTP